MQREASLASISDAFSILDRDWRYTYVNDRVLELTGKRREELIDRVIWEVFPEAVGSEFHQRCHRAVETQVPDQFEVFYRPWGRWVDTRIYPSSDGLAIYRADISDRMEQQNARVKMSSASTSQKNGSVSRWKPLTLARLIIILRSGSSVGPIGAMNYSVCLPAPSRITPATLRPFIRTIATSFMKPCAKF